MTKHNHDDKVGKEVMDLYDGWPVFKDEGFVQPIIVSKDGVVLDGAHRVIAARELGKTVPALVIDADIVELDPYTLRTWLDKTEN